MKLLMHHGSWGLYMLVRAKAPFHTVYYELRHKLSKKKNFVSSSSLPCVHSQGKLVTQ